jgi:Lipocalin-like domain
MNDPAKEYVGAEYQPQGQIRDYFLGAWKLVSAQKKYPDGRTTPFPDLGPDAIGFLLYTPSGHMSAQIMRSGRSRVDDGGFISYCGTFDLKEHEQTMIHRPETASLPNWVGTIQTRRYHLVSPERFFFSGTEQENQEDGTAITVVWTITWERLK